MSNFFPKYRQRSGRGGQQFITNILDDYGESCDMQSASSARTWRAERRRRPRRSVIGPVALAVREVSSVLTEVFSGNL